MSARDRSYRRAQAARIKTRWAGRIALRDHRYSLTWMGSTPGVADADMATRIGRSAATPKACRCCGSYRRFLGATRQERIAALAMTEEA